MLGFEHVDRAPVGEVEPVAAMRGGQSGRGVDPGLRERGAELAHEHTQRLLPGRGRILAPESPGELVPRHRPSVVECEVGEEQTALPSRKMPLVENDTIRFSGNPSREEDLQ